VTSGHRRALRIPRLLALMTTTDDVVPDSRARPGQPARRQWRLAVAPALVALALLLPSQAGAATCGYGTGGAYASNLCWFDMTGYNDTTARSPAGQLVSITLPGGYTATFTLTSRPVTGKNYPIVDAFAVPIETRFAYGSSDYVGVPGRPALYSRDAGGNNGLTLTLSNIQVVDSSGAPVTGYSFVIADAENNVAGENFTWTSNKPLSLIGVMNARSDGGCYRSLTGVGTTTVTCTGRNPSTGFPSGALYDGVGVGLVRPVGALAGGLGGRVGEHGAGQLGDNRAADGAAAHERGVVHAGGGGDRGERHTDGRLRAGLVVHEQRRRDALAVRERNLAGGLAGRGRRHPVHGDQHPAPRRRLDRQEREHHEAHDW